MTYVLLADGFEEIEAVTIIDVLKRADIKVKSVGTDSAEVKGTNGIILKTDCSLEEIIVDEAEAVVLPGGMPGTKNLLNNLKVCSTIKNVYSQKKLVGAICAAPSILGTLGILDGKTACCYPGFEYEMKGANVVNKNVCVDGNIITSRGPGTATQFALELVNYLRGDVIKCKVREAMLCTI